MVDKPTQEKKRKILAKTRWVVLAFCFLTIGIFGYLYYLSNGLPDIKQIDSYRPSLTTKLYSLDNREFAQFAVEKRTLVKLNDVPQALKNAIVAVEDAHFYQHHGIDWVGIARAATKNFKARRFVEGGSTITQQLARALFLTPQKAIVRKLREALLSFKIEAQYSKADILELYLNQVYLGHGAYGVQAAALNYFGKPVSALNLAECAMIAGLPKAPNSYSPIRHPIKANQRRQHVLDRMLGEGYITKEQHQAAVVEELHLKPKSGKDTAPYFTEYIRQQLEQKYGSTALYRDGLRVYTTLDLKLQHLAQEALQWGIKEVDRRQGYRTIKEDTPIDPRMIPQADLAKLEIGEQYLGLVETVDPDGLMVKVGACQGDLSAKQMSWLKTKPEKLFEPGSKIIVKVLGIEKTGEQPLYRLALEQDPLNQGAIVVLDPKTGYILSLVGGYDFNTSKFNRATQARRQPGSSFKPIIYATALMQGMTLADIILDTAIIYKEEGVDEEWKPVNYYEKFYGPTTLRKALEHSRNVVTVKLLERVGIGKEPISKRAFRNNKLVLKLLKEEIIQEEAIKNKFSKVYFNDLIKTESQLKGRLEQIGISEIKPILAVWRKSQNAIQTARRLGIKSALADDLSLALGSSGVTLLELTSAYGVFDNGGRSVLPLSIRYVTDNQGNILEENIPKPKQVLDEGIAYLMTSLLQGVVEHGTGWRAKQIGRPLAGKTGTTNKYIDAWFMGFAPQLVTGVWVGMDENKPLGPVETGSRAASPIWVRFMKEALRDIPIQSFIPPPKIVRVSVDSESGLLATEECENITVEDFVEGTQPQELCDCHRPTGNKFLMVDLDLSRQDTSLADAAVTKEEPAGFSLD